MLQLSSRWKLFSSVAIVNHSASKAEILKNYVKLTLKEKKFAYCLQKITLKQYLVW